jgi:hypothetical protein
MPTPGLQTVCTADTSQLEGQRTCWPAAPAVLPYQRGCRCISQYTSVSAQAATQSAQLCRHHFARNSRRSRPSGCMRIVCRPHAATAAPTADAETQGDLPNSVVAEIRRRRNQHKWGAETSQITPTLSARHPDNAARYGLTGVHSTKALLNLTCRARGPSGRHQHDSRVQTAAYRSPGAAEPAVELAQPLRRTAVRLGIVWCCGTVCMC